MVDMFSQGRCWEILLTKLDISGGKKKIGPMWNFPFIIVRGHKLA